MTITADTEEFIRLHRPHGQLEGDASEPTQTGYLITITCPCGVVFSQHATPGIAVLLRQAVQLFKR